MRKVVMIAESFDPRTLANMEVALERACKVLATGSEKHRARRRIAGKLLECARSGNKTLGGLTEAGRAAASQLCAAKPPEKRKSSRDSPPSGFATAAARRGRVTGGDNGGKQAGRR
jgi:hypothetical protein